MTKEGNLEHNPPWGKALTNHLWTLSYVQRWRWDDLTAGVETSHESGWVVLCTAYSPRKGICINKPGIKRSYWCLVVNKACERTSARVVVIFRMYIGQFVTVHKEQAVNQVHLAHWVLLGVYLCLIIHKNNQPLNYYAYPFFVYCFSPFNIILQTVCIDFGNTCSSHTFSCSLWLVIHMNIN